MSTTEQARQLLTIAETAERLSVSQKSVRRLIDRQEIPALRIGSSIRVDRVELEAWLYDNHEGDATLLLAELRKPSDKSATAAGIARREYALGCLLVDAGLRVSEALGLTWRDVGLVEGVLHVRGQLGPHKAAETPRIVPPKSHRGLRVVPLLPRLQEALVALYAGEDDAEFVLRTRRGTPLSRHNARRSIRDAGVGAKLGHVTPHVLRRTTGTALSEAGVPVATAASILGHSVQVNHRAYVKAHGDALERDRAREALVELGLGVTPT